MGNEYFKRIYQKGFVLNAELLKNGPKFGKDYFDELLVKTKEIELAREDFIKKLLIFIKNVVMIMIKIVKQQENSIRMFRINSILLSQE